MMIAFYKKNLAVNEDAELNFVGNLIKTVLNHDLENEQSDSLLHNLIWKNQNNSVKVYDLSNDTFGLSISYGRRLPMIFKQGIESVIEHLESEFGLTAKDRDEFLEYSKTDKTKDVSLVIVDGTNSVVGRVERDGSISALDYCLEQIKGTVSDVREYVKRFNMAENIKVEALKNYRLLSEYNNIALGCMITEGITQFATWETNAEKDDYYWGHYFGDEYAIAKEDFSERAGLHAKPQFNETELKLIFSSLQFSGKTGDLDFNDLKAVENLKEKISDLLPELKELEEEEIDLGIEPDYPV